MAIALPGTTFTGNLTRLLDAGLGFLFCAECAICGQSPISAGGMCLSCRTFPPLLSPLCSQCGRPLSLALEVCGECENKRPKISQCRSAYWLNDEARRLIHRIKYGSHGELLESVEINPPSFTAIPVEAYLIPVPLHWDRFLQRGFNQSEVLARRLARILDRRVEARALRKVVATNPQSTLSTADRARNLAKAFAWDNRYPVPEAAILIDDVLTTGTTLRTCASVLWEQGCRKIFAWTCFRVPITFSAGKVPGTLG